MDFLPRYKDYNNVELLKIVRQPWHYQPEAVTTAANLLNDRQITDQEIDAAELYIKQIAEQKAEERAKSERWMHKLEDFFEPLLNLGTKAEDARWANLFMLVVFVWFGEMVFSKLGFLFTLLLCWYSQADGCETSPMYVGLLFVGSIYMIAFCILLYNKSYIGWMMMAFQELLSVVTRLGLLYQYATEQGEHILNIGLIWKPAFMSAMFLALMWTNPICRYYNITAGRKKLFLGVCGLLMVRAVVLVVLEKGFA